MRVTSGRDLCPELLCARALLNRHKAADDGLREAAGMSDPEFEKGN